MIGVPNRKIAKMLTVVSKQLDYEHIVIVSSEDGMDEVSLSAPTHVFEIRDGKETSFVIDPDEYGFN